MTSPAMPLELRYHRLELTNRWLIVLIGIAVIALAVAIAPMALDKVNGLTANERVAQQFVLGPNPNAAALPADAYAADAQVITFDGHIYTGADGMVNAMNDVRGSGVTTALKGDPITWGSFVLVNFTWAAPGSAGGDGAFVFTFDSAGKISNVMQSITYGH